MGSVPGALGGLVPEAVALAALVGARRPARLTFWLVQGMGQAQRTCNAP